MANAPFRRPTVELKTRAEIRAMKRAGGAAARTLRAVAQAIRPGVTTKELDRIAEKHIRSEGAIATFVGYRGYPATICVSINDEVVHGIPGSRKIREGDVVSVDVAATVDGFVGDNATTVAVEPVTPETRILVRATEESLRAGIDAMRAGRRLGDVGAAVQKVLESKNLGVVRDYVGHGIGRKMHEEPAVPNYGTPGTGIRLEPGIVLAIEPMATMGDWNVRVLDDGWTVVTRDGSLAAHFEHTVALTENGPVILTDPDAKD